MSRTNESFVELALVSFSQESNKLQLHSSAGNACLLSCSCRVRSSIIHIHIGNALFVIDIWFLLLTSIYILPTSSGFRRSSFSVGSLLTIKSILAVFLPELSKKKVKMYRVFFEEKNKFKLLPIVFLHII